MEFGGSVAEKEPKKQQNKILKKSQILISLSFNSRYEFMKQMKYFNQGILESSILWRMRLQRGSRKFSAAVYEDAVFTFLLNNHDRLPTAQTKVSGTCFAEDIFSYLCFSHGQLLHVHLISHLQSWEMKSCSQSRGGLWEYVMPLRNVSFNAGEATSERGEDGSWVMSCFVKQLPMFYIVVSQSNID